MPGKAERTKARILAAAREVFNRRGTEGADTHDVAAAARMSPGNLYYHYPNKRAIIRDLVDRIEIYDPEAWRRGREGGFPAFITFFFGAVARDRFFFTESARLLREDPQLARLWRARHERLSRELADTAQGWVDAGMMRPFEDDEERDAFVDNAWILCHFAAAYLDARGTDDAHAEAEKLLLAFLRPYHTERGKLALDAFAARRG